MRDVPAADDADSSPADRQESSGLTHLRADGTAHMVDVSAKLVTAREASAAGQVLLHAEAVAALRAGNVPKGDALGVARLAGIQAVKRTPELIPLAHPIAVHAVEVDLEVVDSGVRIAATVRTADRTGIEMGGPDRGQRGRSSARRHGQGGRQARPYHRRACHGEVGRPFGRLA